MVLDIEMAMRAGVVAVVVVSLYFGIWLVGRGRVREALTDRFLYGVPWGSLVTVCGVVAFYLFAQSGLSHWNEPVTLPFRNWAYPYATGMLSSGFAHNSPSHLVGNMLATVVLAPLAEFVWGHYPHREREPSRPGQQRDATAVPETPVPAEFDGPRRADNTAEGGTIPSGTPPVGTVVEEEPDGPQRIWHRPVVRALVIFPGIVFLVSLLTSIYALGWSLGFSGTVFAFLGFVLLRYPITTALSLLAISFLNTLLNTLLTPVLRQSAQAGPPAPPAWAGVNVQAHMLGFLLGVLLALALLWHRDEL